MLTIKRLDLADADAMIAAAKAKAAEINVAMCIAVCDESGNLLAFARMDGSKFSSATLAIDKSFTAAGTRKPTHEVGVASQPGKPAYGISSAIGGRMVVIAGGVPLLQDGVVLGAIGVSAGSPAQDLEVAQAGVQAFFGCAAV